MKLSVLLPWLVAALSMGYALYVTLPILDALGVLPWAVAVVVLPVLVYLTPNRRPWRK